jgi:hypothetical protein
MKIFIGLVLASKISIISLFLKRETGKAIQNKSEKIGIG